MATGARHAIDTIFRPDARTRGTLLSIARPIPDDQLTANGVNRLAAGITWAPLADIVMNAEEIDCDTVYDKTPRAVPALATQPPFLLWDMIQCSTAGPTTEWLSTVLRLGLDPDEFLTAFLAMELETGDASGGLGLVGNGTYTPVVASAGAVALGTALTDLETYLATGSGKPGMRGVIHLTPGLLTIAAGAGYVKRIGDRFETATGHLVIGDAGHTGIPGPQGQSDAAAGEAWIYATADIWYGLGTIKGVTEISGAEGGGSFYAPTNKNRPLYERAALLAFDPHVLGAALVSNAVSGGDSDSDFDGGGA